MQHHRNALQPGFQLHWYTIKGILGQGGFGITYLADDANLDQTVAIKEYLPMELAVRHDNVSIEPVSGERGEQYAWGLDRFISEAQTLARFKHPNIVRVLAVFRENNTAYMVMEYEHGRPLHEILKVKKTLPEDELKTILAPILDGLEAVHTAGFIHRDIKPPNIYIREDGSPVLLDFGSARQSLGEQTRTLTTMVSPGYAPFEQYVSKSDKQGPWTDIYGLAATLYRSVTGIGPVDSMDRSEAILHTGKDVYIGAREIAVDKYTYEFLAAIDHGMAFKPEDRPQTVTGWRRELDAEPGEIIPTSAPVVDPDTETVAAGDPASDETAQTDVLGREQKASSTGRLMRGLKKLIKWLLILLVVLIVLGVLKNVGRERSGEDAAPGTDIPAQSPESESGKTVNTMPPAEMDAGNEQGADNANQATIDQLLEGAARDREALRLTTPPGKNAVEKYQQVLDIEPYNREAVAGLDNVVLDYIRLMDQAINDDRRNDAKRFLDKAIDVNPYHDAIPQARERLAAYRSEPAITDTETVTGGQDDTGRGRGDDKSLVPEEDREAIRQAREKVINNPNSRDARRELIKMGKRMEEKIKRAIEQKNFSLAEDYIEEILQYASEDSRKKTELENLLYRIRSRNSGVTD